MSALALAEGRSYRGNMHTGSRIKEVREQRGITQEDLAYLVRAETKARTALSTVQRWERTGSLKASELAAVARVLQISADYLLGLTDEAPAPLVASPTAELVWEAAEVASSEGHAPRPRARGRRRSPGG